MPHTMQKNVLSMLQRDAVLGQETQAVTGAGNHLKAHAQARNVRMFCPLCKVPHKHLHCTVLRRLYCPGALEDSLCSPSHEYVVALLVPLDLQRSPRQVHPARRPPIQAALENAPHHQRARTGAACQGSSGAPLPHAHLDVRGRYDLDELGVGARWEHVIGLEQRPYRLQVHVIHLHPPATLTSCCTGTLQIERGLG